MVSFNYVITNEIGIHARPAGDLVNLAKHLSSNIRIEKDGKTVDLKNIMALLSLGVKKGDLITITAEGEEEEAAVMKLESFFKKNL